MRVWLWQAPVRYDEPYIDNVGRAGSLKWCGGLAYLVAWGVRRTSLRGRVEALDLRIERLCPLVIWGRGLRLVNMLV